MARYFLGPAATGAARMFGRPVSAGGEVDVTGVPPGQLAQLLSSQVVIRMEDDTISPRVETMERLCSMLLDQIAELKARLDALEPRPSMPVQLVRNGVHAPSSASAGD